jgi:hypothetical protein
LLDVSTDVTAVAVLDEAGTVVAAAPAPAAAPTADAVALLWAAAGRTQAAAGGVLAHVLVPLPGAAVAVVEAHGHRAAAVTGPDPAVALVLFDLRTCLDDAFASSEEAR